MGNCHFLEEFKACVANFLPYNISDHTPALLTINEITSKKPKPFRFMNFLADKPEFLGIVKDNWNAPVDGFAMFVLAKRLKMMKRHMRKLNRKNGNVFANVKKLREEMLKAQVELDKSLYSAELRERELLCSNSYKSALLDEERIIEIISDEDGESFTGVDVADKFVEHFQKIFGVEGETYPVDDPTQLFSKKISQEDALEMVKPISNEEIKSAIFDIEDNKAPGPDGFTSKFFKASWGIVGGDVCRAIKEFFSSGKMLGELNTTIISLVPKSKNPGKAADYRPIACCGVVYKCISKVITNRIKIVLNKLVDPNQGAFIEGRQISDNILLIQELMNGYTWKNKIRRCAFKVDIQKAYDTVSWDFLKMSLDFFGFPSKMVNWIMVCLSTASFSINVNGSSHGFFKAKRGLRQGDPGCKEMGITHLCFADDLMLLCHADKISASILIRAFDEFSLTSGLYPSMTKSTVYFGNVPNDVKCSILMFMPFNEGNLPAKYLGVPLVSRKLHKDDCKFLVECVVKRITDWRNRCLSYAGRLQLISSILSSLQVFWASIFVIPKNVCESIDKLFKNFLWSGNDKNSSIASVAWKDICMPKCQGGLGLKSLQTWNQALMTKHLWNILDNKNSIWVRWVNMYWLKGHSIWSCVSNKQISWCWKEVLSLRDNIRQYVKTKIGDGKTCNVWFDVWHEKWPLSRDINKDTITTAHLSLSSKVRDMVSGSVWRWPKEWDGRYEEVLNVQVPTFYENATDKVIWVNRKGKEKTVSVNEVWKGIRNNYPKVIWYKHVWFTQCIPRHSFILWMAVRGILKTQDKLSKWLNVLDMLCPFCKGCKDSHIHLFFDCPFSKRLWEEVVSGIANRPAKNGIWSIIQRLVLGAVVYFIWLLFIQRNYRLFRKCERSNDKLFSIITETVRLKVMGLKIIRTSPDVKKASEIWGFPLKQNIKDNMKNHVPNQVLSMVLLKFVKLLSLWKIIAADSLERPCTLFLT
ncbi:RNA-directed DNA polymerase, eukaryota, reverse transcriptase zinc-binding domain protein [Tanacetum coccineum]